MRSRVERGKKTHILIGQWMAEGLGYEDIHVLLERRGLRCPKDQLRKYVLRVNRFGKRRA
jgi:hypothetical protein